MMTVYWGRLSEALSHWNKSCLVDFFHCSKNIRTLGCDTKVREEQHTVPTWILQRTPEISTAMNISRRTPQHSLPPCIRKTSSNSPSLPQVISKVTHLVSWFAVVANLQRTSIFTNQGRAPSGIPVAHLGSPSQETSGLSKNLEGLGSAPSRSV